jgi:hypothetical protein
VPGLGPAPVAIAGTEDVLYAAGADGTLRAARVEDPARALWQAALGHRQPEAVVPHAGDVLVLADGGLNAVAR